jgi:hypothetical protein
MNKTEAVIIPDYVFIQINSFYFSFASKEDSRYFTANYFLEYRHKVVDRVGFENLLAP